MVSTLQRFVSGASSVLWPSQAPAWALAHTEALLAQRLNDDVFACECSLALLAAACASYRRETVADPLPFPPPRGLSSDVDQARIALLAELDALPPLRELVTAGEIARLPLRSKALLVALLLASPVRLRTVRHPTALGSNGGGGSGERGGVSAGSTGSNVRGGSDGSGRDLGGRYSVWAEVEVVGRSPNWAFLQLQQRHGTRTAYHGSAVENWHCISHRGLRNHSNTRHERHGAAFGNGVYLATDPSVSRGFARRGMERPRCHRSCALPGLASRSGPAIPADADGRPELPFEIVAVCDVIELEGNVVPRPGVSLGGDGRRATSERDDGDYLVVQDEGHIHLRSLLFFPSDRVNSKAVPGGRICSPACAAAGAVAAAALVGIIIHQHDQYRERWAL